MNYKYSNDNVLLFFGILTEYVQNHSRLPIWHKPLIGCNSTSVGWVSCIHCSFYSKCCSLGVGTISSCRYNIVASRQSRYIGSILSPNNSIKLLGDTRDNTRYRCICSRFHFFVCRLDIWNWFSKTYYFFSVLLP